MDIRLVIKMTNSTLFSNDFATIIVTEVQHSVLKSKAKYPSLDGTELESFLVSEIFNELMDKPESMIDVRMVKRLAGLRTIDYIRKASKNNHITSVKDESGQDVAIVDTLGKNDSDYEMRDRLAAFRATLTDRQEQILELTISGYGTNEICEIVGCSINTPRNTMKKIKEMALDFGLTL
jgi:FixJ family two-component response regulator